jgi:hypothetical protein
MYCGSQIVIDDGSQTINIHNFDEAEIRRIELEAEENRKHDEAYETFERKRVPWRIAVVVWLAVVTALLVASEAVVTRAPDLEDTLVLAAGCVLIFGFIALLVLRPRRPRRRRGRRSS